MTGLADPRDLVGTWRLERTVEDRRAGEQHHVEGRLEILPDDDGDALRWEETLVWHRPDGDLAVRRGLRLVCVGGPWWVRFEDGRDFHPWSPGEPVEHPCPPDTYAGLLEGDRTRWRITWVATGPAKDYTTTSELTPLSPR